MFLAPMPDRDVVPGAAPTFSVVIPAYQAAGTIGDALGSVATQTRPPLEVIVCDDGSTDSLEPALEPWRDGIELLRKENGGGASALNTGVRAASGDFVVILDADDTYEPRRLEALVELATERPDLDIVTTDAFLEIEGTVRGRFSDSTPFVTDDQPRGILRACFIGGWPAIRRSTVVARGGFDESLRIAYDWECWIRVVLSGSRAGCVDEPLMTYRLRPTGLTGDRVASLRARVAMLEGVARRALGPDERSVLAETIRTERAKLDASRPSPVRRMWARAKRRSASKRA
ncbi:MAG TPA: glycosyltransferase family A protein [Gaiellaceae bacterium]|nr:glycosyltransferase family A protein [Gaiellaceae bacterium]